MTHGAHNKKTGFAVIELLIAVVLIGVLTFVAFRVWDANNSRPGAGGAEQQPASSSSQPLTNTADVDTADKSLEQTDIESTDVAELEEQTNF